MDNAILPAATLASSLTDEQAVAEVERRSARTHDLCRMASFSVGKIASVCRSLANSRRNPWVVTSARSSFSHSASS